MRRVVTALVCIQLTGCIHEIDFLDPDVGPPLADRCVNQDTDPDRDVSFSADIGPIFKGEAGPVGCGCHLPTEPNPIGLEQTGLDLSSFAGVRAGGINSGNAIVVPGSPCDSILWQKISPGPPFGARMPFNGPPFLDVDTRQLISDWIAEGARDN